jgi:predicted nucleic acid-binding protein
VEEKMIKKQIKERTENEILEEISQKLDLLIFVQSLQGKERIEQIKILKNYKGNLSKRELEKVTGIDRHSF